MQKLIPAILCVFLMTCLGCFGGNSDSESKENSSDSDNPLAQAAKQLEELSKGAGEDVELISFRDMKEYFPEKVDKYKLSDFGGQNSEMGTYKVSQAEADYTDDDGNKIDISVTDAGGLGIAKMALAGWSMIKIDKEDSRSSERTFDFLGYKSYERIDKTRERAEISMLVEERLFFNVACSECTAKYLRNWIEEFGPKRFGKLK